MASLQHDPFLTRASDGAMDEETPLYSERPGVSKAMVMPACFVLTAVTIASGAALGLSFNETGNREGYEEGHLDGANQQSGCQNLFYWLLFAFLFDLVLTGLTCLVLMPNSIPDTVGVFGCAASFRLFVLSAGFHILYFSGLQRDLCNDFLLTWSTILTWLGVGFMGFVFCYLLLTLLGALGSARKLPPPAPGNQA